MTAGVQCHSGLEGGGGGSVIFLKLKRVYFLFISPGREERSGTRAFIHVDRMKRRAQASGDVVASNNSIELKAKWHVLLLIFFFFFSFGLD